MGMGERVKLADVKRNIGDAFNAAVTLAHGYGPDEEAEVIDARDRVFAFLAQVEAREALLMEALRACQVCAESINDKEVSRAKRMAKDVIDRYGEPGGMNAR